MFKVLPFGLSSACFCFTTLRRPLVKHLRSMSHCCFVYLDNAISGLPQRISAIVACLVQIEWLKIEQEEIEFGAYVSGQWLGSRYRHDWNAAVSSSSQENSQA